MSGIPQVSGILFYSVHISNLVGVSNVLRSSLSTISEDEGVYDFELSVRKSTTGFGVYLTYLGRNQLLTTSSPAEVERRSLSMSVDADWSTGSFLPVLQDVGASTILSTTSTDTFVTSRPGCGLIEVGRYGAIALSSEGMFVCFVGARTNAS